MSKITFTTKFQDAVTQLAQLLSSLDAFWTTYYKREYNTGAANEITNVDIEALEITAADIAAAITLVEQLRNFRDNQPVLQGDYAATLAKVRRDV